MCHVITQVNYNRRVLLDRGMRHTENYMKLRKICLLLALTLIVSGCGTSDLKYNEIKETTTEALRAGLARRNEIVITQGEKQWILPIFHFPITECVC